MYKLRLSLVMFIWGSIGIFSRNIDLSPIQLAFFRAVIALPVLLLIIKIKKQTIVLNNIKPYIISGILIGLAWAALFYGYKYSSISSAIIIYNMCPVYVIIAAPFILKEKISNTQLIIIIIAFIGLFITVGTNQINETTTLGIILSGISGILYAIIVLINRKNNQQIDSSISTFVQIISATVILIPFMIGEGHIEKILSISINDTLLLSILGIVHTGIAYMIYFSVYEEMTSIDIVTYSYLEPIFGIILSIIFIGEQLTLPQIIGGIMILGSTFVGEYIKFKKIL